MVPWVGEGCQWTEAWIFRERSWMPIWPKWFGGEVGGEVGRPMPLSVIVRWRWWSLRAVVMSIWVAWACLRALVRASWVIMRR